jgi:hypothetical protein
MSVWCTIQDRCCCVNHVLLTPWRCLEVTAEKCTRNTHEKIVCSSWHNKSVYYTRTNSAHYPVLTYNTVNTLFPHYWAPQVSWNVVADTGFLCSKNAIFWSVIIGTLCVMNILKHTLVMEAVFRSKHDNIIKIHTLIFVPCYSLPL